MTMKQKYHSCLGDGEYCPKKKMTKKGYWGCIRMGFAGAVEDRVLDSMSPFLNSSQSPALMVV